MSPEKHTLNQYLSDLLLVLLCGLLVFFAVSHQAKPVKIGQTLPIEVAQSDLTLHKANVFGQKKTISQSQPIDNELLINIKFEKYCNPFFFNLNSVNNPKQLRCPLLGLNIVNLYFDRNQLIKDQIPLMSSLELAHLQHFMTIQQSRGWQVFAYLNTLGT
jgi:hypothetical protein